MSRIQTLHPVKGKHGKNIDKKIYDLVKAAMLKVLKNKELNHNELFTALNKELKGKNGRQYKLVWGNIKARPRSPQNYRKIPFQALHKIQNQIIS